MSTTIGLIPPQNLASQEISYAPEIQALGEQCVSIVVRPEKHNFLKFSTPNILKRNFFVFVLGKTLSTRGGNRTGYRPVPTSAQAALESSLLSGFLGNTGPGRAVRVNCRPSRNTRLFKVFEA